MAANCCIARSTETQAWGRTSVGAAHKQALFSDAVDADRAARDLQRVMKKRQLAPSEPLFEAGSPSEVRHVIVFASLLVMA